MGIKFRLEKVCIIQTDYPRALRVKPSDDTKVDHLAVIHYSLCEDVDILQRVAYPVG